METDIINVWQVEPGDLIKDGPDTLQVTEVVDFPESIVLHGIDDFGDIATWHLNPNESVFLVFDEE